MSKLHKAKRTEPRYGGEIYGRDIEGRRERDLNRYLLRHRHETGSNYWYWPDELHPKPISSHAQSAHAQPMPNCEHVPTLNMPGFWQVFRKPQVFHAALFISYQAPAQARAQALAHQPRL